MGTIGEDFTLFSKPLTPDEIKIAIYTKVQPYNVIAAVLQQELIVYCGKLIVTNPELFAGILKVRMGYERTMTRSQVASESYFTFPCFQLGSLGVGFVSIHD